MWPFSRRTAPQPQFPEGRVGFAIGDVHGRADLLALALAHVEERWALMDPALRGAPPVVIFLGDLVDRGPASRQVIDTLMQWAWPAEKRCLMGNHEQSMLGFLEDPVTLRAWLRHGGRETLLSFGVAPPGGDGGSEALIAAAAALNEALGADRKQFLADLERFAVYGDFLFVHAGVDPHKPLEEQEDLDLFWIRERFLKARRNSGLTVVHGHTPAQSPLLGPLRIGIDTGAYATGTLTVAMFCGTEVSFAAIKADGTGPGPPA